MVERKMAHLLPPRLEGENPEAVEPTTVFHQHKEIDYQGRFVDFAAFWCQGRRSVGYQKDHACFVPKKCFFPFTGHTKGVHCIRLFPQTGHLLLSAGLDGSCKVWSVQQGQVMRTYNGHTAAVRDVQFNNDGTKFVSVSFYRYLRLWDTESGKVLGTYTPIDMCRTLSNFIRTLTIFFVVGCFNNKVVAYNATTEKITQEYDHHLAPVNTITFVEDNGTKMVTSSDDKKVLVWEWDIGVPIKYISDPTMHSMPLITMHPVRNTSFARAWTIKFSYNKPESDIHSNTRRKWKVTILQDMPAISLSVPTDDLSAAETPMERFVFGFLRKRECCRNIMLMTKGLQSGSFGILLSRWWFLLVAGMGSSKCDSDSCVGLSESSLKVCHDMLVALAHCLSPLPNARCHWAVAPRPSLVACCLSHE